MFSASHSSSFLCRLSKVPLLEIDGKPYVQSRAIIRHLARVHNFCGSTDAERYRVDMLGEGTADFLSNFMSVMFQVAAGQKFDDLAANITKVK